MRPQQDPTPVLLAWSGGKDSTLALETLQQSGEYDVVGLMTTVSGVYDRVSIHGVRRSILRRQAALLDIPLFEAVLPERADNEIYAAAWQKAYSDARQALGHVQHIAYGDLFLEDVRRFREEQSERMGYTPVFPVWGRDTGKLARYFIASGYEAYLTCVDTTQLGAEFAGRRFDTKLLEDLPASVDPCGERGEFHTCVVAGPLFAERVQVQIGQRVNRDGRFEYCDLVEPWPDD